METSTIVSLVQADLFDRESRGLQKYYTTVDRTDLTEVDWLQHAYEEALDMAVYLKKIIQDKKLATAIPTSVTFNGKTYNLVEASNESVKIEENPIERNETFGLKLKEYKFRIGDKVKVVKPKSKSKEIYNGMILTIEDFGTYKHLEEGILAYSVCDEGACIFFWFEDELELVEYESQNSDKSEEPRKFKLGDKVRILEGDVSKCFGTIGAEGIIEYVSPHSSVYPYKVGELYYPATELQLIEE